MANSNPKLDMQAEKTIHNLEQYEKRWHIFKVCLFVVIATVIVLVQIFTYHRIYDNSAKNRNLLRCTVGTIQTTQGQEQFRNNLQDCLNKTK